ncbi:penicillin-binding protein 1A [Ameyamaea chiangmaiensis NBRC 103196]|nr:penicillin-binding protein 1A [Ameyamaea chiangmaiensis NBRC 103196]
MTRRSTSGGRGPLLSPRFRKVRRAAAILGASTILVTFVAGTVTWHKYGQLVSDLPTVGSLRQYQPPVMSRIYGADDQTVAELAAERRIFVPASAIPDRVKNAIIATEDHKFYSHAGVDPAAIVRAGLTDLFMPKGRRPLGASTITQQVARIMLLGSNSLSLSRKAKEALLAMRIEQTLSKDKILEIYLNEIYLGEGAYGVGAAAQTYFNKPLDQLDNAEAAFLAALPKSPTNYNPYRFPQAARDRRDTVLESMAALHFITPDEARAAEAEPLLPKTFRRPGPAPGSEWFASEVRRQLVERYGLTQTMQGGLYVHTSFDSKLQQTATAALRDGLMQYDRAHGGWRGAVAHVGGLTAGRGRGIAAGDDWSTALHALKPTPGMLDSWRMAVVLTPATGQVGWIEPMSGETHTGQLEGRDVGWMRTFHPLVAGDVVLVEPEANGGRVMIRQVPHVEGALVTLDVHTGRVRAMVGGWSFDASQFNRATQALRQPGSSFKPFVYLTAMEQGISPSQKFDDSPVSYGDWHPNNYEMDFWGPTSLHDALRESRNLVTIRLAAHLGMKSVADMAIRLKLVDQMPHVLPAALGAVETTVLREAGAYATIANGGRLVTPSVIDDVQDRDGHVLWRADGVTMTTGPVPPLSVAPPPAPPAPAATAPADDGQPASAQTPPAPAPLAVEADATDVPLLADNRPQIASPESAFQITAMLQDVIKRGTGTLAGAGIDRPIAGKTGTSQNFNDAWFAGYTPDTVTVVWVGFDAPQSLGKKETGGVIAGPIWNRVMKAVIADTPRTDFRVPEGVTLAQYDTGMGLAIDAFKPGQLPGLSVDLRGNGAGTEALTAADTGAENMGDSESDMAAAPGQAAGGGTSVPAAAPQPGAPASATAPSGGDIGMGGLY